MHAVSALGATADTCTADTCTVDEAAVPRGPARLRCAPPSAGCWAVHRVVRPGVPAFAAVLPAGVAAHG
ncbi:hypothetical protein BFF78_32365 [Streptomyces fodineus]|uniref:Uncharacterized protein n=1 Tax=Streptomyces fodineus TaxID=1904616 RepID=A0A1D7YHW9_9ACTN|nr:hypothetical protein BFF78_32365 [Streptomyces fodineus]